MAKANLIPLKLLVISLGLVLVGGSIFVGVVLIKRINTPGEEKKQLVWQEVQETVKPPCDNVSISLSDLHMEGQPGPLLPMGDLIQITMTEIDAKHVLTIDRCTGKLLQKFTMTP